MRRRRIQAQIDELEKEKNECEQIIASLNSAKSEVAAAAKNLASSASHYIHLPTTAFSGISANATAQGMSGAKATINKSASSIMEVSDAIGVQISRIWKKKNMKLVIYRLRKELVKLIGKKML